jgi:lactobin A/cerein 7B family class IIb bacteriocin
MPTNHTELTSEQLDTVTGGLVNAAVAGAIAGAAGEKGDKLPTLPPDWTETVAGVLIGPWWGGLVP